MELREKVNGLARNSIRLDFEDHYSTKNSFTRFGGIPDVPPDFRWFYFTTNTYDDPVEKPRPLAFLAQFDCTALAPLDEEGLLP